MGGLFGCLITCRPVLRTLLSLLPSPLHMQVALGLIYGAIFPPAYLITGLALLNSYVCTRAGLRYWCAMPSPLMVRRCAFTIGSLRHKSIGRVRFWCGSIVGSLVRLVG